MQQRRLPLLLIGAGLPILPGLAGESKSYAERLFSFPDIGPLSDKDSVKALQGPVKAVGVDFAETALKEIYQLTKGYPYVIQEWGIRHGITQNLLLSPSGPYKKQRPSSERDLIKTFFGCVLTDLHRGKKTICVLWHILAPDPVAQAILLTPSGKRNLVLFVPI